MLDASDSQRTFRAAHNGIGVTGSMEKRVASPIAAITRPVVERLVTSACGSTVYFSRRFARVVLEHRHNQRGQYTGNDAESRNCRGCSWTARAQIATEYQARTPYASFRRHIKRNAARKLRHLATMSALSELTPALWGAECGACRTPQEMLRFGRIRCSSELAVSDG